MHKSVGSEGKISTLEQISRDNSPGIFYSMMTQFCGFMRDTDEYKLMGLAPYGNSDAVDLSWLAEINGGMFSINRDFIKNSAPGRPQPSRQQPLYTDALVDKLGQPRIPGSQISQFYMDVAASAQKVLEQLLISVLKKMYDETGIGSVCLAGGVALNCAANRLIMEQEWVKEIYIQPAAGDAGLSLGAAYLQAIDCAVTPAQMDSVYLGTGFSNDSIRCQLEAMGLTFTETADPAEAAARMISKDLVVGWFQGRSEFGPRALGNRSILANALNPDMKDIINSKVKFRESFRPFCPSVLEEDFSMYFEGKQPAARHMTVNYKVISELVPSVTHTDHTARIQTVSNADNPLFYDLLVKLKKISGHGICINTSFNRSREPIVNSPRDAVSVFYGSGLDALIIGNFILEK
jgi:carbamoyltransferase